VRPPHLCAAGVTDTVRQSQRSALLSHAITPTSPTPCGRKHARHRPCMLYPSVKNSGPKSPADTTERMAIADQITKEYGSSWIFEPCLTWANALQLVQHSGFSL